MKDARLREVMESGEGQALSSEVGIPAEKFWEAIAWDCRGEASVAVEMSAQHIHQGELHTLMCSLHIVELPELVGVQLITSPTYWI